MADAIITVPKPVTHSEGTVVDKATGAPVLDDKGKPKLYEISHGLWLDFLLGNPWWTNCDANTARARVECVERLNDAFDGTKPGDKVRITSADRDMVVDAFKVCRLPEHLSAYASKVRRFEFAWLAAPPAEDAQPKGQKKEK